jgi:anti-sigma regulatory factor (Ser/Thr protein kinase)
MVVSPVVEQQSDVVLALAPDPEAVGSTLRALQDASVPEDVENTVDLLAAELVTNAVRHARFVPEQRLVVAARVVEDHVRVEVVDRGSGFDPEQALEAPGRGLQMVDRLASRWGVDKAETGCRVWFELDRRARRGRFARG